MKKYLYLLAALSMIPQMSLAQSASIANDVEAELDQMYAAKTTESMPTKTVNGTAGISTQGAVSGQPIYILNQATPTSTTQVQTAQVQKQPTTLIESSPLSESKADQIRKNRQDAEVHTEQKIVEKLENSRLEDEKKRAGVLFGDAFNRLEQNGSAQGSVSNAATTAQPIIINMPAAAATPAPAPVVVETIAMPVQTVQKVEHKDPSDEVSSRDLLREEIRTAMDAEKAAAAQPVVSTQKYFSGMIGMSDYPDAKNVQGNYALGASFSSRRDSLIVEGGFMYSNYTVDSYVWNQGYSYYDYAQVDMNSYAGSLAGKFQLLDGFIKPIVGGVVQYTYRNYSLMNQSIYNANATADSQAIDVGVVAGFDLEFSPTTTLGLDYRYMYNMSSKVSNAINTPYGFYPGPTNETPVEKLNYWVLSIVARTSF